MENKNMRSKNVILDLSLEFAIDIVNYTELLEEKKKYVIAQQLLKSGTSIGANAREAQNAESINDFLRKMKISAKEIEETEYWLLICSKVESYPNCNHLQEKLKNIKKIVSKIIITCKTKTMWK